MAYDISSLELSLNVLSREGPAIVTQVKPKYEFCDGHFNREKIVAYRATVIFPKAGYQTLDVVIPELPDDLASLKQGDSIEVEFEGFVARVYDFTDKATGSRHMGISAKAAQVRVVPSPTPGLDILVE